MQTGDEYFDSKEFRDILTSYEESVRSGLPIFMDADDLTDIADYYNYTGDTDRANEVIDFALNMNPGATTPLVFKARAALENENIALAEELAEKIIDKDDPDYKYLKAEILIAQNKIDKAEEFLNEYSETIEQDEYEDFIIDVANLYADYGVYDMAYKWMNIGNESQLPEYKELKARVLFGMEMYSDSAKVYNELIDSNPYSKRYWNSLASAQFMNEDYDEAITSSEYAIAIDPKDSYGLLAKANSLYRLNKYKEALDYYGRYCEINPTDEFGRLHKGICLVNLSRYEDAIEQLETALSVAKPDSTYIVQIYQEMAFAYSAIRNPEKAIEYIDKTDSMDCDHTDMKVLRGHILLENGRYNEAEEMFHEAIINAENAPVIVLRIIVSLYDNKYLDTAYKMFKKLFTMVDDDFLAGYSYLPLCCWDMKLTDEFMHYLKIAVEKNPNEAKNVLGHLFPKDTDAKNYYNYMYDKLKSKDK